MAEITVVEPSPVLSEDAAKPFAPEPVPKGLLGPVRLTVWEENGESVRVEDMVPVDEDFIPLVVGAAEVAIKEQGGGVPTPALQEVVANLIHAHFAGASIIVGAGGREVIVADRGPGIDDPERALLAGYSTATATQRRYIRGTGVGLALAEAAMAQVGGTLSIGQNLLHGAVVSLNMVPALGGGGGVVAPGRPRLSDREKLVLSLLGDLGTAGPSIIAKDLGIPLSTAHRVLMRLEEAQLVVRDSKGKRHLSDKGIQQVGLIFSE